MLKTPLLPHRFRRIGWVLLAPATLLGIALQWCDFSPEQLASPLARWSPWLNNVALVGILAGLLMVACSREPVEDEMIARIRLNALLAALYVHTAVVIVAALTVYGLDFFYVMVYNLFTLPLLFAAIYGWQLQRIRKEAGDDE